MKRGRGESLTAWAWWRGTVMHWRVRIAPGRSWRSDDGLRGLDQWGKGANRTWRSSRTTITRARRMRRLAGGVKGLDDGLPHGVLESGAWLGHGRFSPLSETGLMQFPPLQETREPGLRPTRKNHCPACNQTGQHGASVHVPKPKATWPSVRTLQCPAWLQAHAAELGGRAAWTLLWALLPWLAREVVCVELPWRKAFGQGEEFG